MRIVRTTATLAGSLALSLGMAVGANAASETWATSSSPLNVVYSGTVLGSGYGTLYAEPYGGRNYFNLQDKSSNGFPVYGLSSMNGDVRTSERVNVAASTFVRHNWDYALSANGFIRIGEDAPWRPDILSESIYVSVPTS